MKLFRTLNRKSSDPIDLKDGKGFNKLFFFKLITKVYFCNYTKDRTKM